MEDSKMCFNSAVLFLSVILLGPLEQARASQDSGVTNTLAEVHRILVSAQSFDSLLAQAQSGLTPSAQSFLRKKVKGQEGVPFKIEARGPEHHYILDLSGRILNFGFLPDPEGAPILMVNNKQIPFQPMDKAQKYWGRVEQALPQWDSSWLSPLPRAQALVPALVAVAIPTTIGLFAADHALCQKYGMFTKTCREQEELLNIEQALNFATHHIATEATCQETKDSLRTCLISRVREQRLEGKISEPIHRNYLNLGRSERLRPGGSPRTVK